MSAHLSTLLGPAKGLTDANVLQYYTVAYNHVHTADPPHIVEVSNFTTAFQDAIPRLQVCISTDILAHALDYF